MEAPLFFWIQPFVVFLASLVIGLHGQGTDYKSQGCTFYDDHYVYNIELSKGKHDMPCPKPAQLNDQFKHTEDRLGETTHEVMQLQGQVLRLMDANNNLTNTVKLLQRDLLVTKAALKTQDRVASDCPDGYTVKNEAYKSCYMFVGRHKTWYDAETFCMTTGGHLIGFETQEEQEFIADKLRSSSDLTGNHMWTAGNDIAKEGQWMWAGINVAFNYTRWLLYPHEDHGQVQMPDNYKDKEHCVHMFHLHNYDWNDIECTYKYYFVCEYKLI